MAEVLGIIHNNAGSQKKVSAIVRLSSSYTTGGENIDIADLGMSEVQTGMIVNGPIINGTYLLEMGTSGSINNFRVYSASGGPGSPVINEFLSFPDSQRLYVSSITAFNDGETITGLTSGATATLLTQHVDVFGRNYFRVQSPAVANWQIGETVQGAISLGTATAESNVCIHWTNATNNPFVTVSGLATDDPISPAIFERGATPKAFVTGLDAGEFAVDATTQEILLGIPDIPSNNSPLVSIDYIQSGVASSFTEVTNGTDLSSVFLIVDYYGYG